MNPLTQMIQATKHTTSNNLLKDKAEGNQTVRLGPTRDELNQFLEDVAVQKALSGSEFPEIEAPRVIIEFYNKGNIKGFDDAGYFIFDGVKVFEAGKKEDAKRKESLSMEEKIFGGRG